MGYIKKFDKFLKEEFVMAQEKPMTKEVTAKKPVEIPTAKPEEVISRLEAIYRKSSDSEKAEINKYFE
jgi:hypothetical protein